MNYLHEDYLARSVTLEVDSTRHLPDPSYFTTVHSLEEFVTVTHMKAANASEREELDALNLARTKAARKVDKVKDISRKHGRFSQSDAERSALAGYVIAYDAFQSRIEQVARKYSVVLNNTYESHEESN